MHLAKTVLSKYRKPSVKVEYTNQHSGMTIRSAWPETSLWPQNMPYVVKTGQYRDVVTD